VDFTKKLAWFYFKLMVALLLVAASAVRGDYVPLIIAIIIIPFLIYWKKKQDETKEVEQ